MLGVQYGFLYYREEGYPNLTRILHVGTYWVLAVLVASEVRWLVESVAAGDWPVAFAVVAAAVLALATGMARGKLSWPLARHWYAYSTVGIPGRGRCSGRTRARREPEFQWECGRRFRTFRSSIRLTIAAAVAGVAVWHAFDVEARHRNARVVLPLFTVAGLVLLSMEVARGVHHFAGVPFTVGALAGSATFQAGLSLVWGAAGLAGMVAGAMRERREIWIGGAVVMAS